jgi:hypothetical protein
MIILLPTSISLTDSQVQSNTATAVMGDSLNGFGGGILNLLDGGKVTLNRSTVTGNSAQMTAAASTTRPALSQR